VTSDSESANVASIEEFQHGMSIANAGSVSSGEVTYGLPKPLIRAEITMHWPATKMDCPIHGWDPFIDGPITVVTIPGEHLSLLAPENQPTMASLITDHLAQYANPLDVRESSPGRA